MASCLSRMSWRLRAANSSDANGVAHLVLLMPASIHWGSIPRCEHAKLRAGERLAACLDDMYALTTLGRASLRPLGSALPHPAQPRKGTCVERSGAVSARSWPARLPRPIVLGWGWLPSPKSTVALGAPVGSDAFVRAQLLQSRTRHDALLQRLPELEDLQAFWLLLLFCCSLCFQYLLRMLPPSATDTYAGEHDKAIVSAVASLLGDGIPSPACATAQLPLSLGRLGLHSAQRTAASAYWASWAESLPVSHLHYPDAAQDLVARLQLLVGQRSTPPALRGPSSVGWPSHGETMRDCQQAIGTSRESSRTPYGGGLA